RLISLHANRGVAEPLGFAPFSFRARHDHAQVGHVIGVVLVEFNRAAHVREGFFSVFVSEEGQAGLEFPKSFRIHHGLTSVAPAKRGGRGIGFPGCGLFPRGAEEMRAWPWRGAPKKNVPQSRGISGTARATVARKVPIRVNFERTQTLAKNLLNGRTVLVQRD